MTDLQRKALRILDHAIDSLGPTKSCGLLIAGGSIVGNIPASDSNADLARAILAGAMCQIVREDWEASNE